MKKVSRAKVIISTIAVVMWSIPLVMGLGLIAFGLTPDRSNPFAQLGIFYGGIVVVAALVNLIPWLVYLLRRSLGWWITSCSITAFVASGVLAGRLVTTHEFLALDYHLATGVFMAIMALSCVGVYQGIREIIRRGAGRSFVGVDGAVEDQTSLTPARATEKR